MDNPIVMQSWTISEEFFRAPFFTAEDFGYEVLRVHVLIIISLFIKGLTTQTTEDFYTFMRLSYVFVEFF